MTLYSTFSTIPLEIFFSIISISHAVVSSCVCTHFCFFLIVTLVSVSKNFVKHVLHPV